jgi:hypothetical protein
MANLGAEPKYLPPNGVVDFVAQESPKFEVLLKDIKTTAN